MGTRGAGSVWDKLGKLEQAQQRTHSQHGVCVQRLVQALGSQRIVVHVLQLLGQAHEELVDVCGMQAGMRAGRERTSRAGHPVHCVWALH